MTHATTADAVRYETDGPVARITLNRPDKLNAINGRLHDALLAALARAEGDEAVRAVVLRGAGRAFSAGGDLKAAAAGEEMGHPSALGAAIWNLAKPVLAAVHGYCLGQAYELAAACDLTIATESAQFGEVEINNGWGPPLPITPFAVTLKRAKEILLLGEVFGARQALELGLVNWVVPDSDLDAAITKVTARLTSLPPAAVAANKRLVNQVYEDAGFFRPAGPLGGVPAGPGRSDGQASSFTVAEPGASFLPSPSSVQMSRSASTWPLSSRTAVTTPRAVTVMSLVFGARNWHLRLSISPSSPSHSRTRLCRYDHCRLPMPNAVG